MQNGKKSIPDFLNKVNRSRTRKNSSIQVIDVDHPPPEIQALQISNSDLSEYIDYIWSIASVKPPSRSPFQTNVRKSSNYSTFLKEYPILRTYNDVFSNTTIVEHHTAFRYITFLIKGLSILFELHMEETFLIMRAIGINNTVYTYSKEPIQLSISPKDEVFIDMIRKSDMAPLNSGKKAVHIAIALAKLFRPKTVTIQDVAKIQCDANTRFSLSWFRFLTSEQLELSWYNSFGLRLENESVQFRKKLQESQYRIQNITCSELVNYYRTLLNCISDPDFLTRDIYFLSKPFRAKTVISNHFQMDILFMQTRLQNVLRICDLFSPDINLIEMCLEYPTTLQCGDIATLFSCLPGYYSDKPIPFLFIEHDRKALHVFPQLHDFLLVDPHIAGLRTYLIE